MGFLRTIEKETKRDRIKDIIFMKKLKIKSIQQIEEEGQIR